VTNRSLQGVLDNKKSHSTKVLFRVPQCSVSAPLLFLLYVNDLPDCVYKKIKLYADDVIIFYDP